MITLEDLAHWFTYHAPMDAQMRAYRNIREAAYTFAAILLTNTPEGADQSAAIRKVREAVMTANAAVACQKEG